MHWVWFSAIAVITMICSYMSFNLASCQVLDVRSKVSVFNLKRVMAGYDISTDTTIKLVQQTLN